MSMARMALRRKASRVSWHSNSHILAQRFGAGSLVNGPQRSPTVPTSHTIEPQLGFSSCRRQH
jgi:hypothetical protein